MSSFDKMIVVAAAIKAKASPEARVEALDYLAKAADCFDDAGLCKEADAVTEVIERLGCSTCGCSDDANDAKKCDCNDTECDCNDAKGCKSKKKRTKEERKVFQHSGFTDKDLAEDGSDDDAAWEDEE